jgi:hypothetical protein
MNHERQLTGMLIPFYLGEKPDLAVKVDTAA